MRKPNVIAGLKCPPEMYPSAQTITPIASPLAMATPIRVVSWATPAAAAAPAPTKVSVNAPIISATARRRVSSDMSRNLRVPSDGTIVPTSHVTWAPGPHAAPARDRACAVSPLAHAPTAGGPHAALHDPAHARGRQAARAPPGQHQLFQACAGRLLRLHRLMPMRRRVTFSRNLTLSLSRTCRCYCKYCAFATHRAHLYAPEEVIEILDGAAKRQVKELLVLTGEHPEVNAEVAAKLEEYGHEDFTAYVVWACERALERGLLPHTNLGVLAREDLARLREVTASQGLMLESVAERLLETVHAGSPTKHPARRLETIRAAGELKIPFTSGILVGIGESERERIESLEAIAATHAEHGHIQEVILQNFVPHQRYYGSEPAEIADQAARDYWRTGVADHRPQLPLPDWACPVTIEDMKRLISETRRLMPDIGIQVPPNLADWWGELVAAGATDLGGLSANGDHISPEHPFPSPHQVRKQLQKDGHALTERLCVYPRYIDSEWVAQGVMDTIKVKYWSFIPRRGSGRTDPPAPIRPHLVAGAIAKGRDGVALSPDELTALFAETRAEV